MLWRCILSWYLNRFLNFVGGLLQEAEKLPVVEEEDDIIDWSSDDEINDSDLLVSDDEVYLFQL